MQYRSSAEKHSYVRRSISYFAQVSATTFAYPSFFSTDSYLHRGLDNPPPNIQHPTPLKKVGLPTLHCGEWHAPEVLMYLYLRVACTRWMLRLFALAWSVAGIESVNDLLGDVQSIVGIEQVVQTGVAEYQVEAVCLVILLQEHVDGVL